MGLIIPPYFTCKTKTYLFPQNQDISIPDIKSIAKKKVKDICVSFCALYFPLNLEMDSQTDTIPTHFLQLGASSHNSQS